MQSQPYVSGLSSLSVDGGIITLMDIVIERLFPIAFTNGDRNIRESPWDEEEEKRRQDKWKVGIIYQKLPLISRNDIGRSGQDSWRGKKKRSKNSGKSGCF